MPSLSPHVCLRCCARAATESVEAVSKAEHRKLLEEVAQISTLRESNDMLRSKLGDAERRSRTAEGRCVRCFCRPSVWDGFLPVISVCMQVWGIYLGRALRKKRGVYTLAHDCIFEASCVIHVRSVGCIPCPRDCSFEAIRCIFRLVSGCVREQQSRVSCLHDVRVFVTACCVRAK